MTSPIQLRALQADDLPVLAQLYRDAALVTGGECYSPEQTRIWARHTHDLDQFGKVLGAGRTYVAEWEGEVASFGQLLPMDHISYLYTDPRFARRGCALALCTEMERVALASGIAHLRTEASHLSRGLFARRGFEVQDIERVMLEEGVFFERYRMLKRM